MALEAPQEYPTPASFTESTIEQLLGKHLDEAKRLYYGRGYVEALHYLISIYKVLEPQFHSAPTEGVMDLKYHLFKAWHMSSADKSRDTSIELPIKLWDLEKDIQANGNPYQKMAVEIVDDFEADGTHRQILRILDSVYSVRLVELFKRGAERRRVSTR